MQCILSGINSIDLRKEVHFVPAKRLSLSVFLCFLILFLASTFYTSVLFAQDLPEIRLTDPSLNRPQEYTIAGVEVTGIDKNNAYIIATAGLDEGKKIRIPGNAIPDAIRTLYRTGLFSDVKIYIKQKIQNTVFLLIVVKEQPRLESYEFKKIKSSEKSDLKEIMPIYPGFAITESGKSQAMNTIMRFFEEKGFRHTKVEVEQKITDTTRNRAKLIFSVEKGQKLEVKRLRFIGNKHFKAKKLRGQVGDLKEDRWYHIFSATIFKKEDFEKGKESLIKFYQKNGFRDARIVRDSVYIYDFKKGKEGISVDIELYEGTRYFVRNVTWEGNTVFSSEELSDALDLRRGDVFNQNKFEENFYANKNNTDVSSKYQDIGYLFCQIEPRMTTVGDSLDIHFIVSEDEKATIKEVSFAGNTRTHDQVVRRNLRTYPGAVYSRQNIQRSVRELATLSYFQPESIQPNLDVDYEKKTASIHYSMKEVAGSDNFEFSGGFGGAQIGVIISTRLNFNNFSIQNIGEKDAWTPLPSGDGQKFSLGVQVTGKGYKNFDIGFQEPWLMGRPNSLGVNAAYSLYNYSGYHSEVYSSSISYGQRLQWPDDYFTHTTILQYLKYNVSGSAYESNGNVGILNIQQVIERNSLDNFISPNMGSKLTFNATLAPPIGNFAQFYKLKFKFSHHLPVVGKLILTYGTEMGQIGHLWKKNKSPFDKFFLGGTPLQQRTSITNDNIDLKGYPGGLTGSISPADENGNLVGGNYYIKYLSEIRYPAVQEEQIQLIPYIFAEGGNAYDKFRHVSPFDIKRSAGFGIRLFLPVLGLIDLSYGYRFDSIPNSYVQSGNWEFLFNIGPSF